MADRDATPTAAGTPAHAGLEPQERFVKAGDVRLHSLAWGDGPRLVVCLHGTGGTAWHWGGLAGTLVPLGFRVVAFDQRGHGDSDWPATGYEVEAFAGDLEAAAAALGLRRFGLVGNSLGSRVGLVYAARHPEQVERLVLVDLSFAMPESEQARMIAGHLGRPESFGTLEEALAWSRATPGRARWRPAVHAELIPHEVKQRPDGRWTWRYSRDAAVQGLRAARRDLWSEAARLRLPTLVVRGAESPVLTREAAEEALRRIPHCRLVEIAAAGHGIPRDNPEAFERAVAAFLAD